jgi:hypothetical protein
MGPLLSTKVSCVYFHEGAKCRMGRVELSCLKLIFSCVEKEESTERCQVYARFQGKKWVQNTHTWTWWNWNSFIPRHIKMNLIILIINIYYFIYTSNLSGLREALIHTFLNIFQTGYFVCFCVGTEMGHSSVFKIVWQLLGRPRRRWGKNSKIVLGETRYHW